MSASACPHCQAHNDETAAFCAHCGRAVPAPAPAGPRIVSSKEGPLTSPGRRLQAEPLAARAVAVAVSLFVTAGLLTVATVIFLVSAYLKSNEAFINVDPTLIVLSAVLIGSYIGLGCWARTSPLAAALVGLVLFLSNILASVAINPWSILQGIIIKLIVITLLIQAVALAAKHNSACHRIAGPPGGRRQEGYPQCAQTNGEQDERNAQTF